jgi:hypothetical protein
LAELLGAVLPPKRLETDPNTELLAFEMPVPALEKRLPTEERKPPESGAVYDGP